MTSTCTFTLFDDLAALAVFPRFALAPHARACAAEWRTACPDAAAAMERFAVTIDGFSLPALQEEYTAAFDFDPACALELGWHLYGDAFERGAFLVEIRDALTRAGVAESDGLPDHIAHILPLLAREEADCAQAHAAMVAPAIARVRESLQKRQSPYLDLIAAIEAAVAALRAGRLQEAPAS